MKDKETTKMVGGGKMAGKLFIKGIVLIELLS